MPFASAFDQVRRKAPFLRTGYKAQVSPILP
jgi:hypothetical protein